MKSEDIKTKLMKIFVPIPISKNYIDRYHFSDDYENYFSGSFIFFKNSCYVYLEKEMQRIFIKKFNNENAFYRYLEKNLIEDIANDLKVKKDSESSRIAWFNKQLELAEKISPELYNDLKLEIDDILKKYPEK